MAPRSVGATLGLLAFTTAIAGGLWSQNPITVTLMRALSAMLLFCIIGAVIGAAAHVVVREHAMDREKAVLSNESKEGEEPAESGTFNTSITGDTKPMGT